MRSFLLKYCVTLLEAAKGNIITPNTGCIHERTHMITVLVNKLINYVIYRDNHQSALETQGALSQCTRMQATAAGCVMETIYIKTHGSVWCGPRSWCATPVSY